MTTITKTRSKCQQKLLSMILKLYWFKLKFPKDDKRHMSKSSASLHLKNHLSAAYSAIHIFHVKQWNNYNFITPPGPSHNFATLFKPRWSDPHPKYCELHSRPFIPEVFTLQCGEILWAGPVCCDDASGVLFTRHFSSRSPGVLG